MPAWITYFLALAFSGYAILESIPFGYMTADGKLDMIVALLLVIWTRQLSRG